MSIKNKVTEELQDLKKNPIKFATNVKIDKAIKFIDQLSGDLTNRKNIKGHLSASVIAFYGKKLYFVEHPYLKKILLPAGHVESNEMPLQTAIREFIEETGSIACIPEINHNGYGLIDVNIISIPKNSIRGESEHVHIDMRYYLEVNIRHYSKPEHSVFFLTKDKAPNEFKKYYKLGNG